ncbi:MAG: hemoglobin [Zhongshania sp.]|jgi:hemoglobin
MQNQTLTDIHSREDIERLMQHFYARVLADDIIGFYFTDVVSFSLEHHLPKVVDFWVQQVFAERVYHGDLLARHRDIHSRAKLSADHFQRWLYLLKQCINSCFSGPNAERLTSRAAVIAQSMCAALNKIELKPSTAAGVQFFDADSPNSD